jgi:hypothetical protein
MMFFMIEIGVTDGFLYLLLKSSDFLSHYLYQGLKKNISDQNQNFKKKRDRKPDILKSMRNQRKVCVLIMKPPPMFIIVFTLIPHILILPFVNKLYIFFSICLLMNIKIKDASSTFLFMKVLVFVW